ncbi:hypothetical protein [Pelomonas sp. SE-A7]|uniref:hypothetical protein n=1 Tax=Pelomonas sp. SE-A7 TaxID=3054953 RepID=UPI00259CCC32|nr:hypothetical protein [Pelomonas sp. SE-A7]MDM4764735.1 hypothetical protein [Pelomonas sp. SE-A7]
MSRHAPPNLSGPGYRRKSAPGSSRRRQRWAALVLLGLVLALVLAWRLWPAESLPGPLRPALQLEAVAAEDVDELLAARSSDWRMRRLRSNPAILVIEFPNLTAQGMALNRMAAWVEKVGGERERLLGDTELVQLLERSGDTVGSFLQGHDYPAARLARFFRLSRTVKLNAEELRLRGLLTHAGLLREVDGVWQAVSAQALITFTAEQADDPATPADEGLDAVRRASVLRHELSHGEFFTRPDYAAHCWQVWRERFSEAERAQWRRYLAAQHYNLADEELMVNEMQALLLHTSDARAFNAASLGVSEAVLNDMRERLRRAPP